LRDDPKNKHRHCIRQAAPLVLIGLAELSGGGETFPFASQWLIATRLIAKSNDV
jgi:hypothetical protein